MGDVQDLVTGEDGLARCGWAGTGGDYAAYHDTEWGRTLHGDDAMFERLSLEGFQAGLAWITVLRKRDAFRKAFQHFQIEAVAAMTEADVERLLTDPGIIRSRAKIEAAIKGAKLWLEIEEKEPGGFRDLIWKHVEGRPLVNRFKSRDRIPAQTEMSQALSKELKHRGFNFCGPVIVYAFAQAVGMVNDHLMTCFRHEECVKLGKSHKNRNIF